MSVPAIKKMVWEVMKLGKLWLGALLVIVFFAHALILQGKEFPEEVFEKKIRPVLIQNCSTCHNPKLRTAGLDLTTPEGFMGGGDSGPIISLTNPQSSHLLKVITYQGRIKMPPSGKLSNSEVADLIAWVERGAPWPGAKNMPSIKTKESLRKFNDKEKNFWAFQPIKNPAPPKVDQSTWPTSPIDNFILARLEKNGLKPSPPAERSTLLRRATFDLTGLPPTEHEITQFLADNSDRAFEKVVDRLLASPRYGERWGRHWLDVARYADSTGNDEDHRYPYAWRYRDYIIKAFNSDLPYDQFVREQIAGDLLPPASLDEVNRQGIIATGFLSLGPKAIAQQDKKKMLYDVYDEQLDVTSKAFLGLTVTCARCHDHKFDPITHRDYYSMISIFANTKSFSDSKSHVSALYFRPLVSDEKYKKFLDYRKAILKKGMDIEEIVATGVDSHNEKFTGRIASYMTAARSVSDGDDTFRMVALEKNLNEGVLKKWLVYLQPAEKTRPHLDEWHRSSIENLDQVALAYQNKFQKSLKTWMDNIAGWRERTKKLVESEKDNVFIKPFPSKPKFKPKENSEDSFFYEVYFNDGPFAATEKGHQDCNIDSELHSIHPATCQCLGLYDKETNALLVRLRKELNQLKEVNSPEVDFACAVGEGEIVRQAIFIRGDHNNPGEKVSRSFPKIISFGAEVHNFGEGSGRLELANWLTDARNPLTSRVMANRIWQWHFGEGLVRTPSNFGKMGERPTHPKLLDYMASKFIEQGWSVKKMHRLIMLSSSYRMSSKTEEKSALLDPENRLLSRFFRRRLDIEQIRDGLLAIDGTLDMTMGKTLQSGFGTDGETSGKRISLNPEEINRRLVYLPLRRANLPSLLNLFDFGDATTSGAKRQRTNVAPQALFMMNSEFIATRSRNLSKQLIEAYPTNPTRLIESAYLRVLNRKPDLSEVHDVLEYVKRLQRRFPDLVTDSEEWQSLCRMLMASNEFIFVE